MQTPWVMTLSIDGRCLHLVHFLQTLAGWQHVKVADQRIKHDFAWYMQELVEIHIREAGMIRVVPDNLNPHSPAAFYETFSPQSYTVNTTPFANQNNEHAS
jgi:hypothetical protein